MTVYYCTVLSTHSNRMHITSRRFSTESRCCLCRFNSIIIDDANLQQVRFIVQHVHCQAHGVQNVQVSTFQGSKWLKVFDGRTRAGDLIHASHPFRVELVTLVSPILVRGFCYDVNHIGECETPLVSL